MFKTAFGRRCLLPLLFAGLPFIGASLLSNAASTPAQPGDVREEHAVLTSAPRVPPPIGRRVPTTVHVRLEAREKTLEIAPGVSYRASTFNGTVPGPMIRVFEGDTVSVALGNHPENQNTYSVDFQAATGPGGGAGPSETRPGEMSTVTFKAQHRGLYLYQAGGTNRTEAVANGMYGLMLVEPTYGFRHADREYYLMQSEFYTAGPRGASGPQAFSLEKATAEEPDYVVFNGCEDSLTADQALAAKSGERVRLFVGNAGPNLSSSFHVVGKALDYIYYEGGTSINTDVPTTRIPPGGTAIIELDMDTPGDYEIIDQALFRSRYKGARAVLKVEGEAVAVEGITLTAKQPYDPPPEPVQAPEGPPLASGGLQEKIAAGAQVYGRTCVACHQPTGLGIPKLYPPLAESDFLAADLDGAIHGVIKGRQGEIVVKGEKYNMLMPAQMLKDEEIAQVLTYVLNSFGNPGGEITVEQVRNVRAAAK